MWFCKIVNLNNLPQYWRSYPGGSQREVGDTLTGVEEEERRQGH